MPRALLVTGCGYGDEGKGSVVDYLVRKTGPGLVVRHNGGAQAAHNVVTFHGRNHTFAQWGSGTFAGARTFLSKHMITHPLAMINEAKHLREVGISDPWEMLTVDERALVITPYHQAANRIREMMRGDARHGSCGVGVGEAYEDREKPHAIRFGDLGDRGLLRDKLDAVRREKATLSDGAFEHGNTDMFLDDGFLDSTIEKFRAVAGMVRISKTADEFEILRSHETVIFEGAQGVLLDQFRGVQPWTTWSNTTSENARAMLDGLGFDITKIGVLRAYVTRHGPGPLATFDAALTSAIPDTHNNWNQWQRDFRCGWFDVPLARHAIEIEGGIDRLAITNVDRLAGLPQKQIWTGERMETVNYMVGAIGSGVGIHASLVSCGPTARDKTEIDLTSPARVAA